MKYYAVTEDPNELLHYGVKGMKWGQHIFGDKPKSPGYRSALGKLRSSVSKAAKGLKTSVKVNSAQREINRERKLQDRYAKAVAKTQKRIQISENLHNLSKLESYENNARNQYRSERRAAKAEAKRERRFAKNESKMDKFAQLAREGRLKYGQLSDDQVNRITNRLAIERNARLLGNTEKPKFRTRMKDALQEGLLQGVVQGTAAGMKEVAVAKVQNRLSNKRVLDKRAEQEAMRQKKAQRIKNQKSHKEMAEDIKQEALEAQIREGVSWRNRGNWTAKGAADTLMKIDKARADRQFNLEEEHHALQAARQDRENEARTERQREQAGKMAYEYGYLPSGSMGGGNQGNNKQNKGGKGNKQQGLSGVSNDPDEVKSWSDWYKRVYIDGETNQQKEAKAEKEAKKVAKKNARKEKTEVRRNRIDVITGRVQNKFNTLGDAFDNAWNNAVDKSLAKSYQNELTAEQKRKNEEARKVENAQNNTSNRRKRQQKNQTGKQKQRRVGEELDFNNMYYPDNRKRR